MSWLLGGSNMDDVNVLPASLIPIYQQPHRVLGLDKDSTTVAILRETFRKLCLNYIQLFTGLGEPKLTLRQVLLAYHLCRGTIKGPATRVKESLDGPYFDFQPEDILPILRPVRTKTFPVQKEYRACRMLNISCIDYKTTFSYTSLPKTTFVFDVHYCLRRHTIERDFDGFNELFEELHAEMVTMPAFPHSNLYQTVGLESRDATGGLLADFLTRAHHFYAGMKKFSPRLLRFLGIDFEKIQAEEEGAILSILDTPTCPYQTVWHLIDEKWLVKWRKFAMGRGARRYLPPGPITNQEFLMESRKEGKKELKIPTHYRCVNYNVWRFYELVHGGGPCISRKEQDVYSDYGMSLLQAVIRIQTWVRIFLAKCRRKLLFYRYFSSRQACKAVILDMAAKRNQKAISAIVNREQFARTESNLKEAAIFTQIMWRKKKSYVAAENLERLKYDQEIFAKSKGPAGDDAASSGGGLVVRELLPIVHIGSAFYYERTIHEEEGRIPFQTKRIPATEVAVVYKSTNPNVFTDGSKIISINGNPTISMEYDAIKKRLASAAWPLVLGLEMPVKPDQKPTMHSLLGLPELGDLRYNTFKMLLTNGMQFIKHSPGFGKKPHLSTIKISDNEFFYTSKQNPQKRQSDLYNKFSMYSIKFIKKGVDSEDVAKLKRVNPKFCFEVVNEERGIIFELPSDEKLAILSDEEAAYVAKEKGEKGVEDPKLLLAEMNMKKRVIENGKREKQQAVESLATQVYVGTTDLKYPGLRDGEKLNEDMYHALLTAEVINCLKKLVLEVRGSQQFMDTDGFVTKRSVARTTLRKIDVT